VQFIDGRDLAEWTVRMAENRETGIYNATGPAKELGIGVMLDGIIRAMRSASRVRFSRFDSIEHAADPNSLAGPVAL